MKTKEITLYSFNELSDSAKKRAIAAVASDTCDDWNSDDIMESIEAVCEACNVRLLEWSIGACNQNWKLKISTPHVGDVSGGRAMAWFYGILKKHGYDRPTITNGKWEMKFPGVCGFTGVCWDENVCESIWEALRTGSTIKEAFNGVAYDAGQWLEKEEEYQRSEECILQYLDAEEEVYTEDGERF